MMKKTALYKAMTLSMGVLLASSTLSTSALAANVPAGVKLAATQDLVKGNGMEVSSIDPHKMQGLPESAVVRDLFEGLVNQDGDGNIVPGVAERWESKDNQTFVFHLRKDAKWSNGDPVTAEDFVFSYQRVVDPKTAAPYSSFMEIASIKNAGKIIKGELDKSTLGVKALDANTLEISLEAVVPYFVKMTAHTTMKPVNKKVVEKFGDQWTKPENFVSNGAYVLGKWVINERLELVRNKQYWDDEKTVINKVTYLPLESQVAEMNRFLAGEIHITNELPTEQFNRLKKEHPESLSIVGNLCSYFYDFNTTKAPFDDVRVRKALTYAIDRDVIANKLLGQGEKPSYALTPEITAGFTPPTPEYATWTQVERIKQAKALLKEAGFDENNPLEFKLLYNSSDTHKKIAVAVASMWKTSLGVEANIENQEWKTYMESRREGDTEVTRGAWCADYNEASAFLSMMQSNSTTNFSRYFKEEYDGTMKKALEAKSEDERVALYTDAEKQLSRDMPLAPIYQYVKARLVSPKVGGFPQNNAEDKIYTKDLYLTDK